MPGFLLIAALLIFLNFLFVVTEYAMVRVRSSRIEVLARRGNARALGVQEILSRLDNYLAAIQVGLTIIALALGWVGEPALAKWFGGALSGFAVLPHRARVGLSFVLALALLSSVHIVFGELLPRAIGIQKAEAIALAGAYPLRLFALFLRYPVALFSYCSVSLLNLIGLKPAAGGTDSVVSEEEMRILMGETQEKGTLPLERLLLLENLFDLGSAKVAEAMVPREKVAVLSLGKTWEENLAVIRARRFSRYPLCEDGLDTVIGMVHLKDLLLKDGTGGPPDLKRLRRDLVEVSDTDPLEKLLKSFPDKGTHMALVRDAQGKISGLLTLEDIMEELIGEVHDEFDLPEAWSLMDVLVPSSVSVGLTATDRKEAIAQLLVKLKAAFPEFNDAEVFRTVWERELKFSSAVGRGVAVPHGRLASLQRPMVALGRFAKPVAFPSPDNVPVRLVFLILTPASSPVIQLKVLGRIAAMITHENLRRKLLRAKTAEALLEIVRTADTLLAA